jgi:hypothetical protein
VETTVDSFEVGWVDANTERHLFFSNYDSGLDDIFAVQGDVAAKVVTADLHFKDLHDAIMLQR